ncbi:MAG: CBS domain-containing protein [SAR324 cluster bacterium]|nr:CBS domain-containing protein [SAR324 cluster bacterium]
MNIPVVPVSSKPLTKADFVSSQTVRWCPGCGDYAILANVQKLMPELGIPRENIVFVSGIGCSSRFPYYMNTYGFHTIHGRAPALASGLKIARPDLSVWLVSGDGDSLSIGGNHLLHILRRNLDVNILLFNNQIYGLTKGQYSPTSEVGKKTKSSPFGAIDHPINPLMFALTSEGTFIARTLDIDPKGSSAVLKEAAAHKGTSFVEILQNCIIFNDGAFQHVSDTSQREERTIQLKHGEPLIFGKNKDKGIRLKGLKPEVVELGNGVSEADLLVHDQTDPTLAYILCQMNTPEFPMPMGVMLNRPRNTYEDAVEEQIRHAIEKEGPGTLHDLLYSGEVWEIKRMVTSKGFGQIPEDDFFDNEPQSYKKQDLMASNVGEVPLRESVIVKTDSSVASTIRLMQEKHVSCVMIANGEKLEGIFTEGDVIFKIMPESRDWEKTPISEVMTANPVTVNHDDKVVLAFNVMTVGGINHIPVLKNGKPISYVSSETLMDYISQHS